MIRCEWLASNKVDLSLKLVMMRAVCVLCVFIVLALLIIRTITCTLYDSVELCCIEMVIMVMRFNWSCTHTHAHVHALAFMFESCAAQVPSAIHLLFICIRVGMGMFYWLTVKKLRTNATIKCFKHQWQPFNTLYMDLPTGNLYIYAHYDG